jgi:uncharacterized protein YbjT (DUF2867 family)
MGRDVGKLAARGWEALGDVELVQGDMLDYTSVERACNGCSVVYYLVHSMIAQKERYARMDRRAARHLKDAAQGAGMEQIIYLGGLGEIRNPRVSAHLASRHEVGEILQSGPVPVTVLRAAMILGSGSASFEILRYLVERLPLMITPRWVLNPTQPIAIANVLDYLVGCLGDPRTYNQTFDIGGPDILNYRELIRIYAQEAGLPARRIYPVPVLTPKLSAKWIHWVTPVPAAIAQPLTEGLSVPTICADDRIRGLIPVPLSSCRAAIRSALDGFQEPLQSCWFDSGPSLPPEWARCGDADYAGGTVIQRAYDIALRCPPQSIWPHLETIGGDGGYLFGDRLWRLRGWMDRLLGGGGWGRGRRNDRLKTGDAVDFWRVAAVAPPRELLLISEMRMPGEAVLHFELAALSSGCRVKVTARFKPKGLGGIAYWAFFLPFHDWLFRGMLDALARKSGAQVQRPARRI